MTSSKHMLVYFLLCLYHLSFTQQFHSLNEDFPFAKTKVIFQDEFGFMWFGTLDGLVKYNGYEIAHYRHDARYTHSLPGAQVNAIAQNTDTTLLLGFENEGLCIFSRNTGSCTSIPFHDRDESLHIYSLEKMSNQQIWVGSNNGLHIYNGKNLTSVPVIINQQLDVVIYDLHQDDHGRIWLGTNKGIYQTDEEVSILISPTTNEGFPSSPIMKIRGGNHGEIWIITDREMGLTFIWDENSQTFKEDVKKSQIQTDDFTIDTEGDFWLGTHDRGIYRLSGDDLTHYSNNKGATHGMKSIFTTSFFADQFNNIWIEGDELYQKPGNNKHFKFIDSDEYQVISVYAEEDQVWYCSNQPYVWSTSSEEAYPYLKTSKFSNLNSDQDYNSNQRIYKMTKWKEQLVFSSIRNVYLYQPKSSTLREIPTPLPGAFRDFIIDSLDFIWLPGDNGWPVKINLNDGKIMRQPQLKIMKSVRTVAQEKDGGQWWGTENNGLFYYHPKTDSLIHFGPDERNPETSLSSSSINDIVIHSGGDVWVGTKLGICRINVENHEIEQITLDDPKANTNIVSIQEDDNGDLWAGTEKGLLYINHHTSKIKVYDINDGLRNNKYVHRSCHKDDNGIIYFGGNNGIDYFDPDEIGINEVAPVLYINQVKVNGQIYDSTLSGELLEHLDLNYTQNFIDVELVGLHYVAPNAQQYAYKIQGQNEDWIHIGHNRRITLANLTPGIYNLLGKCANADGVWSESKSLITINISPPFWQTLWFRSLLALTILSLMVILYRLKVKSVREEEANKSKIKKQFAELEMKALRAQINPHFLFNSLNSIRLLIDNGNSQAAKKYLTKFSQLIRKVLDNSSKKFIRLDEELNILTLYLELEKMRFKDFSYSISLDDEVISDFVEIPPLLLQPYVENAIWHGLMHKQYGDKRLDIHIKKSDDMIEIVIEDNGIGRANSALLKKGSIKSKKSKGLQLSADRINYLKDIYGKSTTIDIIDLRDPTGTKVVIRLPGVD